MQHGQPYGELPPFDLELEVRLQKLLLEAIRTGYVQAAHDLAEGGLVTAAAEMCIADPLHPVGMQLEFEQVTAVDLFGEGPSRVMMAIDPAHVDDFEALAKEYGVPAEWIGTTGGKGLGFRTLFSLSFDEMAEAYYHGLPKALGIE